LTRDIKGVSYRYNVIRRVRIMGKRRNFYLSDLQLKRLNSMSKRLGLAASEILRRAIDEYWERFEKKGKK
jgi:hypothetical protein